MGIVQYSGELVDIWGLIQYHINWGKCADMLVSAKKPNPYVKCCVAFVPFEEISVSGLYYI